MLANNNLKVCRMLVRRDFRFHRIRNLILVLAAALVTGLYTFVFLLGSSVESAFLLNYQYSYGSTSHILYTGLTEHQADTISQNANIKSTVRLSTVGQISEAVIGQRTVKLAVNDRDYAKTVLSVPTVGQLPQHENEIAMDEFTMDSLGVLHELGAPVSFQWTDPDGKIHTSEFTLCGWWASPTNYTEACAWITADTARALVPEYDAQFAHNVTLGVNLYQPKELEEQAAEILEEQGAAGVNFTTNLAFNEARREQAETEAMPFYLPAVLVLVCGYLMIYSIVNVASQRDTLFFAELKSLGMTPRQLRVLMTEQGCAVSLLGMIPGWLIGLMLHLVITNRVITGMEENPALYFLSWQPFVWAGICTLITALLAYLLPAVKLSSMMPSQTVRSVWDGTHKRKKITNGRTTLPRLALRTLGYSRFRTAMSAVTLLLAVLLLTSVWIQYVSLKEDVYLSVLSPWDYTLADGSAYLSMQQYNENNNGITEKNVTELRERSEVTAVSGLKSKELSLTASDELRQRIVDYYNQPYDETQTLRDTQAAYPEWCAGLLRLEQTGEYTALVIGLEGAYLDYVLQNCPFTSGSFEEKDFASGDYVLAAGAYREGISSPAEGETVELAGKSFRVMGSVMHDDSYLSGSESEEAAFNIAYILPLEAFNELFEGQSYRQLAVNIDHGQQETFENYLNEYEQDLNRGVGITRRSEYQDNFRAARLNMVLPQLVVSLVLLGIALINFVNMLVVKAMNRKGEFAVYQSLGMTQAQLRRLMFLEGGFHAALMAAVIVPLTILFAWFLMPKVIEAVGSWSMIYTFSLVPLWIFLPIIAVIAIAVPLVCLHFITKGSLAERMRKTE